jgi:hypothetical protein
MSWGSFRELGNHEEHRVDGPRVEEDSETEGDGEGEGSSQHQVTYRVRYCASHNWISAAPSTTQHPTSSFRDPEPLPLTQSLSVSRRRIVFV